MLLQNKSQNLRYIKYFALIIVIAVFFASCEKEDTSVIDPRLTFPTILGTLITPTVFDTSDVNGIAWAKVASEETVASVTVTIKNPLNSEIGVFNLRDDGAAPDTAEGDGKYTGYFTFSMQCRIVGDYRGEFLARNISGLNSPLDTRSFRVENSNNIKSTLSNLVAPDSVQRPVSGQTPIFLEIQAGDPDGLCDVYRVFFNSFKPDTTPSSGNPFLMYDDGSQQHCDAVAGDGKYSLCVVIDNQAQLGYYNFRFNAEDRSFLLSDTLSHLIKVYQ